MSAPTTKGSAHASGATTWTGVGGELAAAAGAVGYEVARRVLDPQTRQVAVQRAVTQSGYTSVMRWSPASLASGGAGLAVLAAQLDGAAPQAGWDREGHELLSTAVGDLEQRIAHHGLFDGTSGVGAAATALSRGGSRYRRLLAQLDDGMLPALEASLSGLATQRGGVPVWTFDVISGLAGVGTYLLGRAGTHPRVRATVEHIVEVLAGLVLEDVDPPAWHTPASVMDETMATYYPQGNLNCGLAHGIPGVLAFLSLALAEGVSWPGARGAVRFITDWLAAHAVADRWGISWPVAVPLEYGGDSDQTEDDHGGMWPARNAWCYGPPGVARAIWLAGQALDDDQLRALAVDAMAAVYRRPVEARGIPSPTLCHGVAGLLQITLRFLTDTCDDLFAAAADKLVTELLADHDPDRPVGFASLEPGGARVDDPGLLDGAAGIALVLLGAAGAGEPRWDRLFLLS